MIFFQFYINIGNFFIFLKYIKPQNQYLSKIQDQFFDWFHNNLKSTSESVLSIVINFNARTCQFNSDTRQPSMDEIAFAIKNYIEVLKEMENIFFKDTLFVVGNTMTIADIQAACQLSFYIVINADLTPFPKVLPFSSLRFPLLPCFPFSLSSAFSFFTILSGIVLICVRFYSFF